jgi:hypothetical protein
MSTIDEMIRGYMDGLSSGAQEYPECHKRRSQAYRHGWLNGMDDRKGQPRDRAEVLRRRAAMILGDA